MGGAPKENSTSSSRLVRLGTFELDPRTGELFGNGKAVQLAVQPLQVLLVLLEHPGELVTREELVRRVWPADTFVDFDHSLNKAVNRLRDALGDSADQPQFIETLPRRGYRLVAPVSIPDELEAPPVPPSADPVAESPPNERGRGRLVVMPKMSPMAGHRLVRPALLAGLAIVIAVVTVNLAKIRDFAANWRGTATAKIESLAVLPLENLSVDRDQSYFADGMTDELITDLAKMGGARVSSRASVMRYKGTQKSIREIGKELRVDAVVEGTITRSGDRVRITAQLIQVATEMHLWAETYDRDLSEVLQLQAEVATDIARRINSVVRPLEQLKPVNPHAYGLYLQGRYYFYQYTSEGWQRAIELFNRAIESDAGFAQAYSGLADAYLVAGAYGSIPAQEALTSGKSAATKALQLDGNLASAHYALATAYTWYDWDWANAEKEFQRGLQLNPNDALGRNWHGGYLSLLGRHDEALDEHERARELDPFSLIVNANLVRSLYWARRYDEAIRQAKSTLQLDPKFGVTLFWLEGTLRHKGMFKDAVALRQATASPERAQEIARKFRASGFPVLLRENAENFKKGGALVEAARCYAQIGEKEEALSLLESCYQHRCTSMVTVKAEPDFDVLRSEPRYQEVVRRVGLQQF